MEAWNDNVVYQSIVSRYAMASGPKGRQGTQERDPFFLYSFATSQRQVQRWSSNVLEYIASFRPSPVRSFPTTRVGDL